MRRSSSTERTSLPSCSDCELALAILVFVEETLNAAGLAVKEVGDVPGEIVEVVFEAAAGDGGGQAVKDEIEALIELRLASGSGRGSGSSSWW